MLAVSFPNWISAFLLPRSLVPQTVLFTEQYPHQSVGSPTLALLPHLVGDKLIQSEQAVCHLLLRSLWIIGEQGQKVHASASHDCLGWARTLRFCLTVSDLRCYTPSAGFEAASAFLKIVRFCFQDGMICFFTASNVHIAQEKRDTSCLWDSGFTSQARAARSGRNRIPFWYHSPSSHPNPKTWDFNLFGEAIYPNSFFLAFCSFILVFFHYYPIPPAQPSPPPQHSQRESFFIAHITFKPRRKPIAYNKMNLFSAFILKSPPCCLMWRIFVLEACTK